MTGSGEGARVSELTRAGPEGSGRKVRPGRDPGGWSWLRGLTGSCTRRRRSPPAGLPAAREDRASSSRERSTSRGRGAARSSSRESGRGARGRGRPARPSPSPSGLRAARGGGGGTTARGPGRDPAPRRPRAVLGGRAPRFDPTAFVKAKEKKQREIRMKLVRLSSPPPSSLPGSWLPPGLALPASQLSARVTCSFLSLHRSRVSPDPVPSPDRSPALLACFSYVHRACVATCFSLPRPGALAVTQGHGDALPRITWADSGRLLSRFQAAAAAAEPIGQWRKRGRSVHLVVSAGPAPSCRDWPRGCR